MRDKIAEFEKRNVQLLAIDPHESHRVRHMLRDVGTKNAEERERYIREHKDAQRILEDLKLQQERQRRDGPEPPGHGSTALAYAPSSTNFSHELTFAIVRSSSSVRWSAQHHSVIETSTPSLAARAAMARRFAALR